jgi:ABC-type multidrug transport system fused ATPase/permease subunit
VDHKPQKNSVDRSAILRYPLRYVKGWILIFLITAASTAFNLLQPWPMKVLVDNVFDTKDPGPVLGTVLNMLPGTSSSYGLLFWVALAGLIVFAVNSVLDVILTFAWIKVGQTMVYDLTTEVFNRVQRRSLLFHKRNSVGDLLNRITGDVWSVHTLADSLMFAPAHALMLTIAMIVIMARMDLQLTLVSLIAAPIITFGSTFFGGRLKRAHSEKRETEGRLQSHLQQTLSGVLVVQAFGQEERERHRFAGFADAIIGAQKRNTLTGSFYNLFSGGLNTIGTGVLLFWVLVRS